MDRDVFYIACIVCIATVSHSVVYYVVTNAGTSVFYLYDRLPNLAKDYISKYIDSSVMLSKTVTLICRDGCSDG